MFPPASGNELWNILAPMRASVLTGAVLLALVSTLAIPLGARDRDSNDRVMVGEDVVVRSNEDLGDVVCIACSIDVLGKVRGDAVAIFGSISVAGEVEGDAVAVMGDSEVAGRVGGDSVTVMGGAKLLPGAEVAQDLVAVLGSVEGESEATIGGSTEIVHGPGRAVRSLVAVAIIGALLAVVIVPPFFAWIAGLVLGSQRVEILAETVRQRAGMSFVLGLAVLIAGAILTAFISFLAPDFIVQPLQFILAATGYAGMSYIVGRKFSSTASVPGAILMGGFAIMLLQVIPILGWLLWFVLFQIAVGAAVLSGFGTSIDWLFARAEVAPMPRPVAR